MGSPQRVSDPVWVSDSNGAVPLTLDSFREQLIRQEETIIFALIERAQFSLNRAVYEAEDVVVSGRSLLDHMLRETERVHATVRRFTSPDEAAFFEETYAVKTILPALDYPRTIKPNSINLNDKVKSVYLTKIVPELTQDLDRRDERTFGSACVADIACLQALSKRIHFGKFIAEAKFQESTEKYTALIRANDAAGIMRELTNLAVEEKVLDRVELKASTYGTDPQANSSDRPHKIDPKIIRRMYQEMVMPITKEVQVLYLLQRVSHGAVAVVEQDTAAALSHFREIGEDLLVKCASLDDVFARVLSNGAAYGVVPLEDKATGVNKAAKLLLASSSLLIAGEHILGDTRYVVLSKQTLSSSGRDKVTLAFGLPHTSGALFGALEVFKVHGINLSLIESLPGGNSASATCVSAASPSDTSVNFFLEFTGSVSDANVASALEALKGISTYLKVLGCYQSAP